MLRWKAVSWIAYLAILAGAAALGVFPQVFFGLIAATLVLTALFWIVVFIHSLVEIGPGKLGSEIWRDIRDWRP